MSAILQSILCTRAEADSRLAICLACPKLGRDLANVCAACSCYMPAKACLRGASCPDGRWDALPLLMTASEHDRPEAD